MLFISKSINSLGLGGYKLIMISDKVKIVLDVLCNQAQRGIKNREEYFEKKISENLRLGPQKSKL